MSPFLWFAIVLTVGYIIYYTVMIMNDLYGKKPDEQNNTEEIDVPTTGDEAIPEEAPTIVSESDDGFMVGDEEYDASLLPADDDAEEASETTNQEEAAPKPSPAETIRESTDAYSEEIEPQFDDEFEDEEFQQTILSGGERKVDGRPKVKVIPVRDEI